MRRVNYKSFEEMPVWKKSMNLAEATFALTEKLPKKEDYGLTSQMRRAALSVSGNIAEGFGRHHTKDKLNFYYDARGSLCETRNYLIYGQKVNYFTVSEFNERNDIIEGIWRELNSIIASLRTYS